MLNWRDRLAMHHNLPNLKKGDLVAGRFRIVEIVGSGGFSIVYRAHQEGMNRFVALKVLKPKASADAQIVERFRREALYASHLSHPNTITLFDYGHTEDGLCYIAMEYLQGTDLSDVVALGQPVALRRVWKILSQCCRSLAEAHRLGLVHRDLKPENIFLVLRKDGEFVKVLDFGVSKAISDFGAAGPRTMAPLTQEGTVFGTPLYMAPEQAMAEEITPAVDVYAMGHIGFEMITGRAAYADSTNAMDVMLRQINDPPLKLPSPWNMTPFHDLIERSTQKDSRRRFEDASDMLA
ncbi:MAG: serine/threonine protein kinase, partial [Bradymonadaceae bacterium]